MRLMVRREILETSVHLWSRLASFSQPRGEKIDMATKATVKSFLDIQITTDAKARRLQAGEKWTSQTMDFFYGVGNEISVDIAVKAAMLRLLADVHEILPDEEWAGLRHDINSTTGVDAAIDRMQSASVRSTAHLA